eukprot:TRINITY_DN774128_c0_g1_i1.p1 TRINITY_DN774128_c0_g1~~TRINITY_DN774128_c0_g1_i1.p1  ORF type:complete len:311 (+),score=73.35 TRINITY_DN774128_c0_g1_i1:45-935(+)
MEEFLASSPFDYPLPTTESLNSADIYFIPANTPRTRGPDKITSEKCCGENLHVGFSLVRYEDSVDIEGEVSIESSDLLTQHSGGIWQTVGLCLGTVFFFGNGYGLTAYHNTVSRAFSSDGSEITVPLRSLAIVHSSTTEIGHVCVVKRLGNYMALVKYVGTNKDILNSKITLKTLPSVNKNDFPVSIVGFNSERHCDFIERSLISELNYDAKIAPGKLSVGYGDCSLGMNNLLQYTAPAAKGKSGSPIFNKDGFCVGMHIQERMAVLPRKSLFEPVINEGFGFSVDFIADMNTFCM